MAKLVLDIETIGENYDDLDEITQHVLTNWLRSESYDEEEYTRQLETIKSGLGFSPLTGSIVAIGVLDVDKNKGAVYYQSPDVEQQMLEENGVVYRPLTEKQMLEQFWKGAENYDEFITFNGRAFDAPFLIARSMVHGVRPTVDLMEGRYLYQQRGVKHIDLRDQLSFYSAVRKPGSLHLWCRALGIPSPKANGVAGDDVAQLYKDKEYLKIAKYNVDDLHATKALYERWKLIA